MSINANDYIDSLLRNLDLIKPEDIPNIELYMDQVTTFMENHLGKLKRSDDDKVLTKTMINNYAKNDLLPSPEKKKYSRDHVLLLTFIYYFKSFLTIGDIKTITGELTENYFKCSRKPVLADIYSELLECFPNIMDNFKRDVLNASRLTDKCMENTGSSDEYLEKFFFISLIGIDVYMKKQMIETMIAQMEEEQLNKAKTDKASSKKSSDKDKKANPKKPASKETSAKKASVKEASVKEASIKETSVKVSMENGDTMKEDINKE